MNDTVYCGNEEALIAFLYDECGPGEGDEIAAHVARCASCAEEIQSLRLTRRRLTAWTPPAAALGFRITQEPGPVADKAPGTLLTSPRWWTQPLPAWAQMAAAVAIFAAGMAIGASRGPAVSESTVANAPAQTAGGASNAATATSVSQQDLAALRAEMARLRNASVAAAPGAMRDEDAVVRRVATLVDQRVSASEARLRTEFNRDRAQLVRDFQTVRAQDLRSVQANFAGFQQVAGQELMQHREAIHQVNRLIGAGQVVPTSLVR